MSLCHFYHALFRLFHVEFAPFKVNLNMRGPANE